MTRLLRILPPALLTLLLGGGAAWADILIATAGPMTGPSAAFGEQMRRGAQAAVDDINATGGLKGERLALQVGDDGCDPRKAVDVATSFVSAGVKFVAGHFCSGSSIPAAKVYETAGIVEISPTSSNPKFTDDGGWNVARVCARDDAQGVIAGKYIAAHFAGKRIALASDKSPASQALAAKLRQTLAGAGESLSFDEIYQAGGKDYTALAQKLSDGLADVVYFSANYPEAAMVIKAMRGLGSAAQFIGEDSLVTDEFWTIAKDNGEGTLMTFAPDPLTFDSAKDVVQHFTDAGFNPEGATLYAYAAVQAYVQAAEATGGTDSHRIAAWLRAGNRVKTVLGEISLDAKGDVKEPKFAWFRWSQGHYGEAPDVQ